MGQAQPNERDGRGWPSSKVTIKPHGFESNLKAR